MTAAATSEFSAATGTTEAPQHWLDQVTLEGDAKREFLARTLKELHPDDFLDWMSSNKREGGEPQTWESAARNVGNWEIIALMREKLFGDENKNNLPEFLMSGISLDLQDQSFRQTLLMGECSGSGAAKPDKGYRAERLAEALGYYWVSIDPSLRDSDGETIYTLAAKNQQIEILGMVLTPLNGSGLRNNRGESPLGLLVARAPDCFGLYLPTEDPSLWENVFSNLINHHDFAGMPKKEYDDISEALERRAKNCFVYSEAPKGYGPMYLKTLAAFNHANDQYHREETAQLKAQLAAAQEELGKKPELAALLRRQP